MGRALCRQSCESEPEAACLVCLGMIFFQQHQQKRLNLRPEAISHGPPCGVILVTTLARMTLCARQANTPKLTVNFSLTPLVCVASWSFNTNPRSLTPPACYTLPPFSGVPEYAQQRRRKSDTKKTKGQ